MNTESDMGMDVSGRKPTTEQGEYFRNNVWWWRPLANYVCEVAPEIAGHCEYWQSNDGDGLNAEDSAALADKLQQEIDSGRTERYAVMRAPAAAGEFEYPFSTDNVRDFVAFLRGCGGFSIW